MKDVPVIVLSDGESNVPVSSKHRMLSKNSTFVNNNEFKLSDNHKLPSIPKTLIDESTNDDVANSTDDDVANSTDVRDQFVNLILKNLHQL
nr:hypothetical protein [Tanacetum cinerariifolium]